jgi:two-component system response regulator NreC
VVARKSVVIVEDSESYRQLLNIVLDLDDRLTIVGEAADMPGAVEVVRKHSPDLVVLDFELADGPCGALIPELRAVSPRSRIVVHSADPDVPCDGLGADACFDKDQGVLGLVDVLLDATAA